MTILNFTNIRFSCTKITKGAVIECFSMMTMSRTLCLNVTFKCMTCVNVFVSTCTQRWALCNMRP